jgi:signal transduction histidine kinase/CheY-like chemotaxis protein/CHASE3 domain sensor protein
MSTSRRSRTSDAQRGADRCSVRRGAFVTLAVVLAVVGAIFIALAAGIRTATRLSEQQRHHVEALQTSTAVERLVIDLETGLRGYLLTHQRTFLKPYEAAVGALPHDVQLLTTQAQRADGDSASGQYQRVLAIRSAILDYELHYAGPLVATDHVLMISQVIADTGRGKRIVDALRDRFEVFDQVERARVATAATASAASGRHALWVAAGGFAVIVALIAGLAAYLVRCILDPITRVAEAARVKGDGLSDVRARVGGSGEVAALGQAFNAMADSLDERDHAIDLVHQRLQGVLDHAGTVIYIKDTDGAYEIVNRAFLDARDLRASDVIGHTEAAFSPPEVAAAIAADDEAVVQTGEAMSSEYTVPTPAGERTYLSVKFPIPARDGSGVTIGGISTDITEQKAATEAVLDAARAKSEFLANMSHELRTPLNGVIGMAHLLSDTALTATQRRYVGALGASGEALLAVIGHVLDFSKLEARKLELDPTDFDLHRLIRESCLIVAETAHRKGVALNHALGPDVAQFVTGDRARLRQILLNLLSNAVKFTAVGQITVTASADDGGRLRFEVTDTGVGVPPGARNRLFAPFAQADQSTTRKYGGTGLGLAISRELVQLMGGEIGVRPHQPTGSVFWFTAALPVADAFEDPSEEWATRCGRIVPGEDPDESPLVLIAEDNEVNQIVATTMLQQRGLRTHLATDGFEAVAMSATQRYAVIFMDCQMPGLDGYEATARIRASGANRQAPIIAITAHSTNGGRERCISAGMDDYLAKPVRPEQLNAILAHWLPGWMLVMPVVIAPDEDPGATLDPTVVAGLQDGLDAAALTELLAIFEQSTQDYLSGLQHAVTADDTEEVCRLMHQLKGSGAALGALTLSDACRSLELKAKQGATPPLSADELGRLAEIAAASQSELRVQLLAA